PGPAAAGPSRPGRRSCCRRCGRPGPRPPSDLGPRAEGLEQAFNSLGAPREAAEAYIASQKNEGWTCLSTRYDDGGFTGGNMDGPALQRLLADIEAGQVDAIV